MAYTTINYQLSEAGVARVDLNLPVTHNALSPLMMQEMYDLFSTLSQDETVRVVVLSGEGKSFCAGGDLKWMESNLDKPRDQRMRESGLLSDLFRVIDQCPKLLIARINGAAFGGGVGLISVCDIAIAADTAIFSLTEVRLGLVPANIAPYVLRKIGSSGMRRLALNATRFDASKAQVLGLLDEVVDAAELDAAVDQEIKLALAAGPNAMAATKVLIAELQSGKLADPAQRMVEVLADTWEGEEAQSGIRAFFAKTLPPWRH